MDIRRLQLAGSKIFEFMRHARGCHEDLACPRLDFLVPQREQGAANADDDGFGVGVAV